MAANSKTLFRFRNSGICSLEWKCSSGSSGSRMCNLPSARPTQVGTTAFPEFSGCYALLRWGQVVYVGQSRSVLQRLSYWRNKRVARVSYPPA